MSHIKYTTLLIELFFFLREDFIRKSTKTKNYAIYKIYTYMYIPPRAAYTNTIHNT